MMRVFCYFKLLNSLILTKHMIQKVANMVIVKIAALIIIFFNLSVKSFIKVNAINPFNNNSEHEINV